MLYKNRKRSLYMTKFVFSQNNPYLYILLDKFEKLPLFILFIQLHISITILGLGNCYNFHTTDRLLKLKTYTSPLTIQTYRQK